MRCCRSATVIGTASWARFLSAAIDGGNAAGEGCARAFAASGRAAVESRKERRVGMCAPVYSKKSQIAPGF